MSVRAVQEFVVHIECFRNIDLWYQGAYLLRTQLYFQSGDPKSPQRTHAHPFAHTENYFPSEQPRAAYDPQVIKPAFTHVPSSSFLSKTCLLRYFEEEVEFNDICHFRVEPEVGSDPLFYLEVSLLFFNQQVKKIEPEEITVENGRVVKTKRYLLRNCREGLHESVQVVFDGQYFSVGSVGVHAVGLDYRMRLSGLQLAEFSRLTQAEKRKLLERSKKMQGKPPSYLQALTAQLKAGNQVAALQMAEEQLLKGIKRTHQALLKEYGILFSRVLTEQHKTNFSHLLVHPSQLGLFEQESTFSRGGSWQDRLFKRYKTTNCEEISERMLDEVNMVSGELLKLWHHFVDLIKISPRFTLAHYEEISRRQLEAFWGRFRRLSASSSQNICVASEEEDNRQAQLEKELFQARGKLQLEFSLVSEEWVRRKDSFPIVIETVYPPSSPSPPSTAPKLQEEPSPAVSLHLVVLVHGFQGNSIDMRLIKNNLSVLYPEAAFLCATSNEELTDHDIADMGVRLANEVKNHILEFFPPDTLQRLSFVGHSLGGVIIRAALPKLADLRGKFHAFISFSSPHLGYRVNASSVIEAGIWVLQKVKSSYCLKQLTLADAADPRESCLYRLSLTEGLAHFQHIFLFSSRQDSYGPFQSSRIEIHPDFVEAKDALKEIHCEMVRNIMKDVRPERVHRLGVNFTIEQTNIDSLIGRTAHILFLENHELIQTFLHTHPDLLS